jgi:2'-5' RNA ligase
MRLFIAIELRHEPRSHLLYVRDHLKSEISNASFTRDENLHITLKFLSEVEQDRLGQLTDSLAHIRVGGAIELFADQIECFPNRGHVRIIAAGFAGGEAGVGAIHQAIEQRCQHLRFERETREYRPHVTLARARPTLPAGTRQKAVELVGVEFPGPRFAVTQFALVESHLLPKGSEYQTLHTFQFVE